MKYTTFANIFGKLKPMEIKQKIQTILSRLTQRLSERQLMFILAVVVGIAVGIMGHLLKESIHIVQNFVTNWGNSTTVNYLFLIFPAIGITLTVLFVKYWVKDDISHGVTKIFYAISRRKSRIKPHNCYTSVVSSSITIGFGGSVGAEAPIVLTGAAIGSNVGQFMKLKYNGITLLLGCGAAAAIAAVYKAPIAGFAFVLEVLMLELTFTSIVPLLIASVTAATTTYLLVGLEPFFHSITPPFALKNLPLYAVLGILGGFASYYFTIVMTKIEGRFSKIKRKSVKIAIGGGLLGLLIFIFPPLYGEGYNTIEALLRNNAGEMFNHSLFFNIQGQFVTLALFALGIILFKAIATTMTTASGGIGGTFAPSLFVGAVLGFLFAVTMNHFFGLNLPISSFTLVGMAAVMSGMMKAPLTSMFLVAELTGGFQLFMPLMLASVVSFMLSYYFDRYSIYTKRLAVSGELMTHNKDENTMLLMSTSDLIETDIITIKQGGMLRDILKAVETSQRNLFAVVDEQDRLAGIIYLDDIRQDMFNQFRWDKAPLSDYTTLPPERIYIDEPIKSVVEKFELTQVWNLPVVDRHNKYLGFISKSRLMTAYREQLQQMTQE